ncbi:hypothetical protein AN958_02549 [Leucoagaricus sp. SymC.cos]|nr:hypothetical protein AN958_02549 [Leucoagaricus sp. SymC.cos]
MDKDLFITHSRLTLVYGCGCSSRALSCKPAGDCTNLRKNRKDIKAGLAVGNWSLVWTICLRPKLVMKSTSFIAILSRVTPSDPR